MPGCRCRLHRSPARLIASNAGVEGEVIVEALSGQPFQMGYNAMDDRIEVRSPSLFLSARPPIRQCAVSPPGSRESHNNVRFRRASV